MTVGIPAGGAGSALPGDELYREIILDHYRHPRHKGVIEGATGAIEANNPLCGDEVALSWRCGDGKLEDLAFTGRGCSICMASSSLMCESLAGRPLEEVGETVSRFRAMLLEGETSEELGDLEALQGVAAYPVRIKCAILAWNALRDGLAGEAR